MALGESKRPRPNPGLVRDAPIAAAGGGVGKQVLMKRAVVVGSNEFRERSGDSPIVFVTVLDEQIRERQVIAFRRVEEGLDCGLLGRPLACHVPFSMAWRVPSTGRFRRRPIIAAHRAVADQ